MHANISTDALSPLCFPNARDFVVSLTRESEQDQIPLPAHAAHVPGTFLAFPDSAGSLWILELHNRSENLLTHEVINHGLKPALDVVEQEWRMMWRKTRTRRNMEQESSAEPIADGCGALIITSHGKYFCGGASYVV